jgi:Tol biopolymer transport system component
MTKRKTIDSDWGAPMNLGPAINSVANEAVPSISHDGLLLFFSGAAYGPFRADGCGNADLWVSSRVSTSDPWSTRMNLGQYVNSSEADLGPNISADGSTLYFSSKRDGGEGHHDLWQVSITAVRRPSRHVDDDSAQITIQGDNGKEG